MLNIWSAISNQNHKSRFGASLGSDMLSITEGHVCVFSLTGECEPRPVFRLHPHTSRRGPASLVSVCSGPQDSQLETNPCGSWWDTELTVVWIYSQYHTDMVVRLTVFLLRYIPDVFLYLQGLWTWPWLQRQWVPTQHVTMRSSTYPREAASTWSHAPSLSRWCKHHHFLKWWKICVHLMFLILFFLGRGNRADQDLQHLALSKRSVRISFGYH